MLASVGLVFWRLWSVGGVFVFFSLSTVGIPAVPLLGYSPSFSSISLLGEREALCSAGEHYGVGLWGQE